MAIALAELDKAIARKEAKARQLTVGRTMTMRRVPELRFKYDDSVDRGERIDALLRGDVKHEE